MDVSEKSMPVVEIFSNVGMEELGINFKDMLNGIMPKNTKRRKIKVPEALQTLTQEEAQSLIAEGVIKGGMVAKMESAFEALNQSVPRVHIIQWQGTHTLQEIVQQQCSAGTTVTG
jgi:ATP-dependent HslUV protease ATP-binding subunit HslU